MVGLRVRLFLLLTLVISFTITDARNVATEENIGDTSIAIESKTSTSNVQKKQFCQLCEELAAEALFYIGENETQAEIVGVLHQACSKLRSLKQQCITLVDYYAPLLFLEITTISPEQFCEKVNLCKDTALIRLPKLGDVCTLCHQVVDEILAKLEDSDTQLDVIEMLLKACTKVETYVQQCKKLVFEYGPLILADLDKFLETKDICTSIHACKASKGFMVGAEARYSA
ncbi:prosaposin-like [Ananas comosus]|uniref:Pulmonary surfactant-associated protein B n=1 Tax=Ananas comosus TaxID=4615 RepID=A0A199UPW5_ANACO|nr:prosaposin-like [Ananas comosus]XP_020087491.1 prosaposin-like [Ananas comosus]XP_020087492.1 prosaposin-like [Ananas comosus]OAY66838.1 Prosaposin [Ananas comosus]